MSKQVLNGRPVRIVEFDGLFEIQVREDIIHTPFTWPWQKKKPSEAIETWWRIGDKGLPTFWGPSGGGLYSWSKGEPVEKFKSLKEAMDKIESIKKGVIVHNL